MDQENLDKLARLCAKQKARTEDDNDGNMPLFLRRLPDDEAAPPDYPNARWEIDLPNLGTTVFGESPKQAFKNAVKAMILDYDEREGEDEPVVKKAPKKTDKLENATLKPKPTTKVRERVIEVREPKFHHPKPQPGQVPPVNG